MLKKMKIGLMSLVCVGCLAAAVTVATPNGVDASAETTPVTFKVDEGAAVRLKQESTDFGIRFSATVGEAVEGAKYNMLILPEELLNYYNADATENKADIVTYMKALAAANNGALSIVEDCMVCEDGKIYGSIVDVQWKNINRNFVGVAYYEKDGAVVVADLATTNFARSIVDVSNEAYESGKYTAVEDKAVLIDKIKKGEKQEAGYAETDTYIYEDFRYATIDDKQTGSQIKWGIADTWSYPCIVEANEDYGLQFKRVNDAWGLLTLNFGTVKAGNYKLTYTMEENAIGTLINEANPEKGAIDYNNWKWMGWNGSSYDVDYGYMWTKYYVGNNTFEFYVNQAEDGELKLGIAGLDAAGTFAGQGQILLDNMCLEPVNEIPTVEKKLNVFKSANFDDMVSPFELQNKGIYMRSNMTPTLDAGEDNTVTVNTSAYGAVALYLGTLSVGQYTLKIDATMTNGFPAVMGGATMSFDDKGNITYENDIYFDYSGVNTLPEFAPASDGTYTLTFRITTAYENFALYFANNVNAASSMTINNISFEKVDYTKGYTLDFENGYSHVYRNSIYEQGQGIQLMIPMIRTVSTEANLTIETIEDVETGNHYLHVKDVGGWHAYVHIYLGYMVAGTYTVSLDFEQLNGPDGKFVYYDTSTDKMAYAQIGTDAVNSDGNRYTYTFTLSKDVAECYIGFRAKANDANTYEFTMDNITITKTA